MTGDATAPDRDGREGHEGGDSDGSDGRALPESGDRCDACPEGDDGIAVDPTIYESFWRDARAELERRDYAKLLATVGGITAVGSLAAPVAGLTRVFDRKYQGPVYTDGVPLVDAAGERVGEDRLSPGELLTVFPEPRPGIEDAPTLLVRFEESAYASEVRDEYVVSGYAAFSKVCTHAGCMVDGRDGTVLVCPCHSGRFDPTTGARVVGGPPPRSLPQLPITVSSDGYLVATGDFQGPVGAGGE
ncbi:QcrA and Rieske domain-containing protein [Halorubrum depositum]|uniref:QcrA and Rieske domain-containing protein n=1 Tax=Halorubrum depositum TaxID=2583992 RepID=UPI0011A3D0E0|nr:Rieske 2Fe-2S domain-containing protein [Halorubrum depositum]